MKVNAVEALERQLRRTEPGCAFVTGDCDGRQPLEAERRLTRCCCGLLLDYGFWMNVLTKNALVLRGLDLLAGRNARIGITVTTLDERLRELWKPGCSSLTPILANLLYLACSRRREYLAHTGSARFSRYPEGLASALEKIALPLSRAVEGGGRLRPGGAKPHP